MKINDISLIKNDETGYPIRNIYKNDKKPHWK